MSNLKLLSKILRLKSLKVTNFWLKERELHLAVKPYDACRSVGSVSECFGVLDQREEDGLWALVRNRPPGGFASRCGRVVCVHTCGSVHSPCRGIDPVFRVAYRREDVGEGPGASGPS